MLNITETQADIIKLCSIFYLSLIANYIGTGLFPRKLMNTITTHKPIQLFSAFLLLFFSVNLSTSTDKSSPIEKLFHSFIYFIGFIIVIRLDMIVSALIILFIFIIYFIELNKDFYLEPCSHDADNNKIDDNNKHWITFNTPYKIRLFKVNQSDFGGSYEVNGDHILCLRLINSKIINELEKYIFKFRDTHFYQEDGYYYMEIRVDDYLKIDEKYKKYLYGYKRKIADNHTYNNDYMYYINHHNNDYNAKEVKKLLFKHQIDDKNNTHYKKYKNYLLLNSIFLLFCYFFSKTLNFSCIYSIKILILSRNSISWYK
jgi:hypothetical protein